MFAWAQFLHLRSTSYLTNHIVFSVIYEHVYISSAHLVRKLYMATQEWLVNSRLTALKYIYIQIIYCDILRSRQRCPTYG